METLHASSDLIAIRATELIVLVAQIFPGVPQQQATMFYLARCKHELDRLSFCHSERSRGVSKFLSIGYVLTSLDMTEIIAL